MNHNIRVKIATENRRDILATRLEVTDWTQNYNSTFLKLYRLSKRLEII